MVLKQIKMYISCLKKNIQAKTHIFLRSLSLTFLFFSTNIQIRCHLIPKSVDYWYTLEIIFAKDTDVLTGNIDKKYKKITDKGQYWRFRHWIFFTMVEQKAINTAVQTNISFKKNECSNRCHILSKLSYRQNSFHQSNYSLE